MANLTFPRTPNASLKDLWAAAIALVDELDKRHDTYRTDITIGTTETTIAHGLGFAPKCAIPIPHSDARIWRTRAPDNKYLYFAASGSVVADIKIFP